MLYLLDRNSRTTLSKVAKSLKTSEQRISYTLKSMTKKRQIKYYATVFDYSKFDYNAYLVLLRIIHKNKELSQKIVQDLKELPEVVRIESLQGKFDISAVFLSPNPSSFNKTLKRFISEHKKTIKENNICTVIVMHKYGRQYLNPWMKSGTEDMVIGGDRSPVKLSESEELTCKALLEKPEAKFKELNKMTGLTFKTVSSKIKNLKKRKIVRKFEPILDCNRLKITNKLLLIKYSEYDVSNENKLTSFCKTKPEVVSSMKTFGSWDLIINFEALKEEKFDNFMTALREEYEELIADFEIIPIKNKEKFSYLPTNHFKTK